MNRNYVRGRAKEYRVKSKLEKQGWLVLRTAGSHGPFDLVAIAKSTRTSGDIRLIQVKSGKSEKREAKKALAEIGHYAGTYNVTVEVL